MDIEYEMIVEDKNGKFLGRIDHIVMDSWSGQPRKFIVRLEDDVSAVYFSPDNVVEVKKGRVKLNLSADEMEST